MKYVVKFAKAIPWALLGRLVLKGILIIVLASWKSFCFVVELLLSIQSDRGGKNNFATATSIPDDAPNWVKLEIERDPSATVYY